MPSYAISVEQTNHDEHWKHILPLWLTISTEFSRPHRRTIHTSVRQTSQRWGQWKECHSTVCTSLDDSGTPHPFMSEHPLPPPLPPITPPLHEWTPTATPPPTTPSWVNTHCHPPPPPPHEWTPTATPTPSWVNTHCHPPSHHPFMSEHPLPPPPPPLHEWTPTATPTPSWVNTHCHPPPLH